jgi:hypothetical protein
MSPILIALALSLAANAGLGWLWLEARDDLAIVALERDQARGAASACSDATEALFEAAGKRAKEAAPARAKAKAQADKGRASADKILLTPATVPGNDCKSASDRVDAWLKGRQ